MSSIQLPFSRRPVIAALMLLVIFWLVAFYLCSNHLAFQVSNRKSYRSRVTAGLVSLIPSPFMFATADDEIQA